MYIKRETLDDVLLELYPVLLAISEGITAKLRGESTEILGALLEIEKPRARLSRSETLRKAFQFVGRGRSGTCRGPFASTSSNVMFRVTEMKPKGGVKVYGGYGPRLFGATRTRSGPKCHSDFSAQPPYVSPGRNPDL